MNIAMDARQAQADKRQLATATSDGFTLIELLVALAIIGMTLTAMPLVLSSGQPGPRVRAATLAIADELRALRATAIANNTETSLALNLQTGRYQQRPGQGTRDLPKGVTARFVGPRSQIEGDVIDIRFFPDGSSTGGKIGFVAGGIERWVAVQWISGKVAVNE